MGLRQVSTSGDQDFSAAAIEASKDALVYAAVIGKYGGTGACPPELESWKGFRHSTTLYADAPALFECLPSGRGAREACCDSMRCERRQRTCGRRQRTPLRRRRFRRYAVRRAAFETAALFPTGPIASGGPTGLLVWRAGDMDLRTMSRVTIKIASE